jgi:hypothetical protein
VLDGLERDPDVAVAAVGARGARRGDEDGEDGGDDDRAHAGPDCNVF